MTRTEAAQLVIQAGAIQSKSNVFVLNMGKSVKIADLIHNMIQLILVLNYELNKVIY